MNGQGQMQPSEFLKFRPSRSHAQFPTCHKYPAARKLLQMAAAQRRTHPLLKYNSEVGLFEEEPKIDPLGGVGRREGRPEGMNERIGLLGIYGMEFALCIPCPCPPTDNDLSLFLCILNSSLQRGVQTHSLPPLPLRLREEHLSAPAFL